MATYTFRKVRKFDVDQTFEIMKSKNNSTKYGSITPTRSTAYFGNQTWSVFECTRFNQKSDVIFVDDNPIDEWETRQTFNLYINPKHTLLVVDGSTKNAKGFLDKLDKTDDNVDIIPIKFDFERIANRLASVQQAWIAGNEAGISTVAYMGSKAKDKDAVREAIKAGTASYLGTVIDVNAKKRKMGFSQKGAIMLINANQEMNPGEKLDIVYTTYQYVTNGS